MKNLPRARPTRRAACWMRCSKAWNWPLTVVRTVLMRTLFRNIAGINDDQAAALSGQYVKASPIAPGEPVAVVSWNSSSLRIGRPPQADDSVVNSILDGERSHGRN